MQLPRIHWRCIALAVIATSLAACATDTDPLPQVMGGNAERGRTVLSRYECGVCHVIPGIPAAVGRVGPSLDRYAQRPYVAGKFPNEPETLVRWIVDAPSMAPLTAMPAIAMSQQDARDAAAYLYSSD
jgi:cytochrome c551/c552